MISVIWTAQETAPFSGKWSAVGTTLYDGTISDSKTFDNREQALARAEYLNRNV